jgi:protein TonB
MRRAILVLCGAASLAVSSIAAAQPVGEVTVTSIGSPDGTVYVYAIGPARGDSIPKWDPLATPDPPLSFLQARVAAERWLASRTPQISTFELSNAFFGRGGRCGNDACWFYRMIFNPVLNGRTLVGGGPDFTAVVLLDGSIVEPRANPSTPQRGGRGQPPGGPGSGTGGRGQQPGPDGIYTVGGGVLAPQVVRRVQAEYTTRAMAARISGTVIVECVVNVDGTVRDPRVLKSVDPELDQQAVNAVTQSVYSPGTLNGAPVPVRMTVVTTFNLR